MAQGLPVEGRAGCYTQSPRSEQFFVILEIHGGKNKPKSKQTACPLLLPQFLWAHIQTQAPAVRGMLSACSWQGVCSSVYSGKPLVVMTSYSAALQGMPFLAYPAHACCALRRLLGNTKFCCDPRKKVVAMRLVAGRLPRLQLPVHGLRRWVLQGCRVFPEVAKGALCLVPKAGRPPFRPRRGLGFVTQAQDAV